MIRLATYADIPQLVEGMLTLKNQSGWAQYDQPGYNRESLREFLTGRLADRDSVCYVWDAGTVTAFCGGTVQRFVLPPYMSIMSEWGWTGSTREAVECWVACKRWAKKRGVELAHRVLARPGSHARVIREEATWEVL